MSFGSRPWEKSFLLVITYIHLTLYILTNYFDLHFWCQSRTQYQYFQWYWFSTLPFQLHNLWRRCFPSLHNAKISIISKTQKDIPEKKHHYSAFLKTLSNRLQYYFSFHTHSKKQTIITGHILLLQTKHDCSGNQKSVIIVWSRQPGNEMKHLYTL